MFIHIYTFINRQLEAPEYNFIYTVIKSMHICVQINEIMQTNDAHFLQLLSTVLQLLICLKKQENMVKILAIKNFFKQKININFVTN